MHYPVVLTIDEADTSHETTAHAVSFLCSLDWDMPRDVLDYKQGVANRALVQGFHLLFWDATSFLLAGQHAGLWKVRLDHTGGAF